MTTFKPEVRAASQELMEELMGSVVSIDYLLRMLMAMPAEALPGDQGSDAIRGFLVASVCREVEVVGEEGCRAATALIRKVIDRIGDDVDVASQLAGTSGQLPC
jgi:hypothetical protein